MSLLTLLPAIDKEFRTSFLPAEWQPPQKQQRRQTALTKGASQTASRGPAEQRRHKSGVIGRRSSDPDAVKRQMPLRSKSTLDTPRLNVYQGNNNYLKPTLATTAHATCRELTPGQGPQRTPSTRSILASNSQEEKSALRSTKKVNFHDENDVVFLNEFIRGRYRPRSRSLPQVNVSQSSRNQRLLNRGRKTYSTLDTLPSDDDAIDETQHGGQNKAFRKRHSIDIGSHALSLPKIKTENSFMSFLDEEDSDIAELDQTTVKPVQVPVMCSKEFSMVMEEIVTLED